MGRFWAAVSVAVVLCGCMGAAEVQPNEEVPDTVEGTTQLELKSRRPNCSFHRGVTTCTSTDETTDTQFIEQYSDCTAFNGTTSVPGRRTRIVEQTFIVVTTSTTKNHGHNGSVFDQQTTVERHLVSERTVADRCEAISRTSQSVMRCTANETCGR